VRGEGQDPLPGPAGNTLPSAAQVAADLLYRKGTLLAHEELVAHRDVQVLPPKAAFQLVSPQCLLMPGVAPSQVQDSAFHSAELREVPVCLVLQPAELPVNGSTTIW